MDREREPLVHGGLDHQHRAYQKQRRGDQSEKDERRQQAGPYPCALLNPSPLEVSLYELPEKKVEQGHKQKDVYDREHYERVLERMAFLGPDDVIDEADPRHKKQGRQGEPYPPFTSVLYGVFSSFSVHPVSSSDGIIHKTKFFRRVTLTLM